VPPFLYNGVTYDSVVVDSNGYLFPGKDTASENNNCCAITPIPNPAKPNNVLAPFWTDLDGTGAPGLYATVLTDGVSSWIVIEWRVNDFGTLQQRRFQVWIGTNGTQDISFAYDGTTVSAPPAGQNLVVGAENVDGSGGQGLPLNTVPAGDLTVVSSDPTPGATVNYSVTVRGLFPGGGTVTSTATTPLVPGTTVVKSTVTVSGRINRTGT